MKNRNLYIFVLLLLAAAVFVWRARRDGDHQTHSGDPLTALEPQKSSLRNSSSMATPDIAGSSDAISDIRSGRALSIPPAEVKELTDEVEEIIPARAISLEDAILAAAGLGDVKPIAISASATEDPRKDRLKSIMAKDWEGQGNLLVNELRAAQGFEVSLQTVEDFLRGKDLFGWPEGQRNWIGDEMMTMLRQEMPQQAYRTLSSIQADVTAPDAMRDYSIQHISHLIADGHVGSEGVALIRAAYESGNLVLASTALISLHRLSEKSVDLISPNDVRRYAEQSQASQDERLKMTAQAILKEGE